MVATSLHQDGPKHIMIGRNTNGIMITQPELIKSIATVEIFHNATNLKFRLAFIIAEIWFLARYAKGSLSFLANPDFAWRRIRISLQHLETHHLHRYGIQYAQSQERYIFSLLIMHTIGKAIDRIVADSRSLLHLWQRFQLRYQRCVSDIDIIKSESGGDTENVFRLIPQRYVGEMAHLEHHRDSHHHQRHTDNALCHNEYPAKPHLATQTHGALYHIYRIVASHHDGWEQARQQGDDEISHQQASPNDRRREERNLRIQDAIK